MADGAKGKPTPKRGDARVHRQHALIYYVHSVTVRGDDVTLAISTHAPGHIPAGKKAQSVSEEDWYFKTDRTCDRPVCSRCVVRVGKLEYCGAHGRALAERAG